MDLLIMADNKCDNQCNKKEDNSSQTFEQTVVTGIKNIKLTVSEVCVLAIAVVSIILSLEDRYANKDEVNLNSKDFKETLTTYIVKMDERTKEQQKFNVQTQLYLQYLKNKTDALSRESLSVPHLGGSKSSNHLSPQMTLQKDIGPKFEPRLPKVNQR